MKLFFYRSHIPNFGDELNPWLLPKIFEDFFDDDPTELFLGIGSILYDDHPKDPTKIVFGSGYGGYTSKPTLDLTWKVYGVRGPRTAEALGLEKDAGIGDAAILINRYRIPNRKITHKFGFIPHWESLARGRWPEVCRIANIHFLDPSAPVEQVLEEIQECEIVIAEAMHGAIVADALRVPWIPVLPIDSNHHFKWHDWAEALDVQFEPQKLKPSTSAEIWTKVTGKKGGTAGKMLHRLDKNLKPLSNYLIDLACHSLVNAAKTEPYLSTDKSMDRAVDRLSEAARKILSDFK
ncbi:hypothetical protein ACO34A_20215 [Rhizobium sp. ACO-34A]|nr:polysaccharide pyruvyl transferase family protein [Rhizobium sp. ACO-34A]ATN36125.1 hypothetical protein ACO34A_20215 [Rhizobium sp. ACO-34A]